MVTTYVNIQGQQRKVEVNETILYKLLNEDVIYYYDSENNELVVGV